VRYIILHQRQDCISRYMLADFEKQADTCVLFGVYQYRSQVVALLKKVFFYPKWNMSRDLPFRGFFYRWFALQRMNAQMDEACCVIITNEALIDIDVSILKRWRKGHPNVRLCCLTIDPLDAPYASAVIAKRKITEIGFDSVITFDLADAEKYGYQYTNSLYSAMELQKRGEVEQDVFFVSAAKQRLDMLHGVYRYLKQRGCRCHFSITGVEPKRQIQGEGLSYNHLISYDELLLRLQGTDCILEVVQHGQSGVTLRYYEAVVYNKKLLTNNENIRSMPFYNPKYMRIFHSVDEIDLEWIRSSERPDYHYNGEFSPLQIRELFLK